MSLGEATEISEGIYAYLQPDGSWYINNTGFLVNGTGVISIDAAATERRTRAYLDAIKTVTSRLRRRACRLWRPPGPLT